jgi:hypothetical protein
MLGKESPATSQQSIDRTNQRCKCGKALVKGVIDPNAMWCNPERHWKSPQKYQKHKQMAQVRSGVKWGRIVDRVKKSQPVFECRKRYKAIGEIP